MFENLLISVVTMMGCFMIQCVVVAILLKVLFWLDTKHLLKPTVPRSSCILAVVLLIMLAKTFPMALASIMFFGVFAGGAVVFRAMVWPEYFGRFAVGSIQGVAELFRVIGGAMGPLLAGLVYDITRDYYVAFIGFSAACILGALFMYLARPSLLPIRRGD